MTHGERVKASIIEAGLALWRDDPASVSARAIGQRVALSHSAVLYHFGDIATLRGAIAAEAVRIGDAVIVPMLIAVRHPAIDGMAQEDRAAYLAGC